MTRPTDPVAGTPYPEYGGEPVSVPDLAQGVYKALGIDAPGAVTQGYRTSMAEIKPGDLVGWYGGDEPDGRYVGNIAVYAGNREIIESAPGGTSRRRKLADNENCFGIPVDMPDDITDV